MWLPAVTTIAAAQSAIALADAKMFLRIDADETGFDTEIGAYSAGAVADLEQITGTRLITQTVRLAASSVEDLDRLPIGPVQSITAVHVLAADGTETLLSPATYELFGGGLAWGIRPAAGSSWPSLRACEDAIRVTAVVGYGNEPDDVPQDLHVVLLRAIRAQFDDKPFDMETQLSNRRIWM